MGHISSDPSIAFSCLAGDFVEVLDGGKWKILACLRERAEPNCPTKFVFGGVVGRVQLGDCVDKSRSKWFEGPVGWVVSKPKKLPFTPLKGRLGLFDPPQRVLKKLGLPK